MSALLPFGCLLKPSTVNITADTYEQVLQVVEDAMYDDHALFATRADSQRFAVVGYGRMRDGTLHLTLRDLAADPESDDALLFLTAASFARAFDSISLPAELAS